MNRFWKEISIISPIAWVLAVLAGLCMFCTLFLFGIPRHVHMRYWDLPERVLFSIGISILFVAWVLLIGYINADARRRGMRYVMWTFLAIFVPNSIGIILYFVLRDPLMVRCPQCGAAGRTNFVFCPQCGGELCPICPNCKRSVDPVWKKCAYCGTELTPSIPAPRPAPIR